MSVPAYEIVDAYYEDGVPGWKIGKTDTEIQLMEELAEFLVKMDHEGGLLDMIHWGGIDAFPDSLKWAAKGVIFWEEQFNNALTNLKHRLGVDY
jgi:hypothetical protein